ncbi:MAG: glutathione S-transferase family protein [Bdellovibrionales bacterium]|nr:glutathione S-transferase family protein [Bdellovibrionales bacterium]
MIHLYQWPPGRKIPNLGPFCMKLEAYLRISGLEHRVISTTSLSKSPKKTMPFAEIDGQLISDSQVIIEILEKRSPRPMDFHLNAEQRAHAVAYRGMLETHLVPILVHFRWVEEAGWAQFGPRVFGKVPALIRPLISGHMRRQVIKRLNSLGVSRHSVSELCEFAQADISAVANLLGTKQFVFGSEVSTLDLVIFSVIGNILEGDVDMPLIDIVKGHQNLVDHMHRVLALFNESHVKGHVKSHSKS